MVINATQALNSTLSVSDLTISRFTELIFAPYFHVELLWIAIPLIASLIMMDIYFGRYKKEELGWNTAVGNSLALTFVAMDLLRKLYTGLVEPSFWNLFSSKFKGLIVVLVLGLGSLWLFLANFLHILPKRFAFLISSSLPTTVFAYLAIVIIYTGTPIDWYTLMAGIVLFLVLLVVLKVLQFFIPVKYEKWEIMKMFSKKD